MSAIQIPGSSWQFYQHAIIPGHGLNADFAKTSNKTGEIYTFKFPYSGSQVEVVLKWDLEHKKLEGTYTWDPASEKERKWNNIEFEILNDGNVLEGIPEGINGLRTWILAYDNPKKDLAGNGNSYCVIS